LSLSVPRSGELSNQQSDSAVRCSPVALAFLILSVSVGATPDTYGHAQAPFTNPIASPFETRSGFIWEATNDKLRLDIGMETDLLRGECSDSVNSWTLGVGMQTWTRLRSEGKLKFPVETVDYWFGLHAAYGSQSSWHGRIRLAHISSHLADGVADTTATLHPAPFVYSREFCEVIGGYPFGPARVYAGATVVWSTQPRTSSPVIPQAGADVYLPVSERIGIAAGYDVRLIGIQGVYRAMHAAQAGLHIHTWNNTGILLSAYAMNGRSIHGMFYTESDSYLGVGIQILTQIL